MARRMRKSVDSSRSGEELRTMMRKVIATDATDQQLRDAIKAIEDWVGDDQGRQSQLGRMAGAVLDRGLGSADAQQTIKRWHQKYGSPNR